MAAVALFEFPCPVPCAALGKFLRFVRALRAGIVFLDAVDFVVNKNTRFLRGVGSRVTVGFAAGYRLFLFFKA